MRRTVLLGLGILFLFYTPQARADQDAVDRAAERITDSRYGSNGRLDRYARHPYTSDRLERYRRISDTRYPVERGKRGRKYIRRFSYPYNLSGDKLAVFEKHGYTPHRLGIKEGDVRKERWIYYSLGVEYTFDHYSGELIDTRYFPAEPNHID